MINKKLIFYLFPTACLVFLITNQFNCLPALSETSNLLAVPILSFFFYLSVRDKLNSFCVYILLALLSIIIGDGLIMFAKGDTLSTYFMVGLIFSFIANVFFIIAFINVPNKRGKGYLQKHPGRIIASLLVLIFILVFLWPDIPGNLRTPIVIYAQSVTYMILTVQNLKNQIATSTFYQLFTGTLFFIFSVIIAGLIRFKVEGVYVPKPRLLVVLPYYISLYLLVVGSLKLTNSN